MLPVSESKQAAVENPFTGENLGVIGRNQYPRVDTHISRLRNKLHFSSHSDWDILTIYGYGYRLQHVKVLESAKLAYAIRCIADATA